MAVRGASNGGREGDGDECDGLMMVSQGDNGWPQRQRFKRKRTINNFQSEDRIPLLA